MTGNFLVPVSLIVGPCAGDFRGSGFRLGRIIMGRVKHKTSSAYMLSNKGIYTNDVFDENTSLPIGEETNIIYTKNPEMSILKCSSRTSYVLFKWIQCENTLEYTKICRKLHKQLMTNILVCLRSCYIR